MDQALERASVAQREWARRPLADRVAVLRRYHDLLLARQQQVLDVTQVETGKARVNVFGELLDAAMTARYYASTAARHLKPTPRQGAVPGVAKAVEHHHPKGVIGVISPWTTR